MMRNAALILGLIGGCMALIVGFVGYGYVEIVGWFDPNPELAPQVDEPRMTQTLAILSPILAITGAAMAPTRALWGGVLLLLAVAGFYHAFGIGIFTVFPLMFCALAGVLAIAAGRPDEARRHF